MIDRSELEAVRYLADLGWLLAQYGSLADDALEAMAAKLGEQSAASAATFNPLIDLAWIAKFCRGGETKSALSVAATYYRSLMPLGISPHPLINASIYKICNPDAVALESSQSIRSWVEHLLKLPERGNTSIVPFLSNETVARLRETCGANLHFSPGRMYLSKGIELALSPHPFFDPLFVLSQRGASNDRMDPFDRSDFLARQLHWYLEQVERGKWISPSVAFDEAYYRASNSDASDLIRAGLVANAFHAFVLRTDRLVSPCTELGIDRYWPPEMIETWSSPDRGNIQLPRPKLTKLAIAKISSSSRPPRVSATIDGHPPGEIVTGEHVDLIVHGSATSPSGTILKVRLQLGYEQVEGHFQGYPRPDLVQTTGTLIKPTDRLHCGFSIAWHGRAPAPGNCPISVSFGIQIGQDLQFSEPVDVGLMSVKRPAVRRVAKDASSIQIAMATYNPDPVMLARQIGSISRQTYGDWRLIISDESTNERSKQALALEAAREPRISLSHGVRLGFLGNFERALRLIDRQAQFFAFADQDDFWYPEKLTVLVGAIQSSNANLVHSDMRLCSQDGRVISDSFWIWRQRHAARAIDILMANTVTGAAMLAKTSLLRHALPFPHFSGVFHDMWIALVAATEGRVEFVKDILQDYIQHDGNVLGNAGPKADRVATTRFQLDAREIARAADEIGEMWQGDRRLSSDKLENLWPHVAGGLSATWPAILQRNFLAAAVDGRFGSHLGKSFSTVLGKRGGMAKAYRDPRRYLGIPQWLAEGDNLFKTLDRSPRARNRIAASTVVAQARSKSSVDESVSRKIEAQFATKSKAASAYDYTVILPELRPNVLFAGYLAKLQLARALVNSGKRVRLALADQILPDSKSLSEIAAYHPDLYRLFFDVTVESWGNRHRHVSLGKHERIIATSWWTAYLAAQVQPTSPFLYLIQEYEPLTVPPGSWSVAAENSYNFKHHALFSTKILRDFFEHRQLGLFSADHAGWNTAHCFFDPPPIISGATVGDKQKLIVCYMRPEGHAARNLYDILLMALELAIPQLKSTNGEAWKIVGIGASKSSTISVAGRDIEVLARQDVDTYKKLLGRAQIGVALMNAPHPSMVPLDMAAAGMRVITTTYETKTKDALAGISPLIYGVTADPHVIASALANLCKGDEIVNDQSHNHPFATKWDFDLNWIESLR